MKKILLYLMKKIFKYLRHYIKIIINFSKIKNRLSPSAGYFIFDKV